MQKLKRLFLSLVSLLLLIGNSFAANIPQPIVDMTDRVIGPEYNAGVTPVSVGDISQRNAFFSFKLMLGKTKTEIENENSTSFYLEGFKIHKQKYKNYDFLIYSSNYVLKTKGIYIFDKNEICVGYAFWEQEIIFYRKNEPEIIQIKNLPQNPNYLIGELNFQPSVMTFYEKIHNNYVERYALSEAAFYMEAFYPKELDEKISEYAKNILNFNYEHNSTIN